MAAQDDHELHDTTTPKAKIMEHIEEKGAMFPPTPKLANNTSPFMVFFAVFVGMGGWIVNFDLGYSGIVLQMTSFNRSFGTCAIDPETGATECLLSATQQSIIAIYVLFMAVGGGVSALTGSYMGRRPAIQLSCLVAMIGAAGMLGSAGNFPAYVVCKCIQGFGTGHLSTNIPIYGTEVTPPHIRGLLVSLYSFGLAVGQVTVAAVCVGSSGIVDDWAWQTPLIIQIPVGIIYSLGLFLFPESPRWLLVMGKEEQGRLSFARLYSMDAQSEEVTEQVQNVQYTIAIEQSINANWIEIFKPQYIRRTFTACGVLVFSALGGVNFIVPYTAIFLAAVGLKNVFLTTFYITLCILAGTALGTLPCQYLGRRITLLTGYAGTAACMLIVGAVGSGLGPASPIAQRVLIAFFCLWTFLFGAFNASTTWLTSVEQHAVRLRTYGQAFTMIVNYIFNFAVQFWTPYQIRSGMGTNIGYFYFGLLCTWFILTFFSLPETGHLTLEQIDNYYHSGIKPWRTSLKKNKQLQRR